MASKVVYRTNYKEQNLVEPPANEAKPNIWSVLKKTAFILGSVCIIFAALGDFITFQLQRFWGASGSFWQYQWDNILYTFGNDSYKLVVYGSVFIEYVVFWTVGLLYTFMDLTGKPQFLRRYKIQPGTNEPANMKQLIKVMLVVHFNQLVMSLGIASLCYSIYESRGCDQSRNLPMFQWVLFELVMFIIIEEIVFYYSHRLLHHPLLYKHIHKMHHEWQAPIAVTALYAHPIEYIFSNVVPIFMGPLIMGSHVATSWLWYSIAILSTLNAHSGYHMPFFPSPEAHDFHHLKFNQCYGVLGILDFIHGTDVKFRASKSFSRHIMMLSFTPPREEFPDVQKSQKLVQEITVTSSISKVKVC